MKKIILFIITVLPLVGAAQIDSNTVKKEVFDFVEQMPEYKYGDTALAPFIAQNTKYPINAFREGKMGTIIVQFIVEEDGKLSEVVAAKSFDQECADEAVRVVKLTEWIPGKQRGKNVRVMMYVPVRFEFYKIGDDSQVVEIEDVPPPPPPREEEVVYEIVEEMPEYIGGQEAMYKFISKNLDYPKEARKKGIEGTVILQFVIDAQGNVTHAKILRDIGEGCGQVALEVINKMPQWKAGKQRGKAVPVMYRLPVKFKLE